MKNMLIEHFLEGGGEWYSSPFFKLKAMQEPLSTLPEYKKAFIIDAEESDIMVAEKFMLRENVVEEVISERSLEGAKKRFDSDPEVPDLIFIDLLQNSKEMIRFLNFFTDQPKEKTKNCKIILHSAMFDYYESDVEQALKFPNVVTALPKPLDAEKLAETIKKCKGHEKNYGG